VDNLWITPGPVDNSSMQEVCQVLLKGLWITCG
jgi:hypothetical protein